MALIQVRGSETPEFKVQHRDRDGRPTGYTAAPELEEDAVSEAARCGYRLPPGVRVDVDDGETMVSDEAIVRQVVRHFGR